MALPINVTIQKDALHARTDRVQLRVDGVTVDPGTFTPYSDGGTSGTTIVKTLTSYIAGDYDLEARATDIAGNVGSWSTPAAIEHRPTPPRPVNLGVNAGTNTLTWCWTDPGEQ
jgi:hypothetical protein